MGAFAIMELVKLLFLSEAGVPLAAKLIVGFCAAVALPDSLAFLFAELKTVQALKDAVNARKAALEKGALTAMQDGVIKLKGLLALRVPGGGRKLDCFAPPANWKPDAPSSSSTSSASSLATASYDGAPAKAKKSRSSKEGGGEGEGCLARARTALAQVLDPLLMWLLVQASDTWLSSPRPWLALILGSSVAAPSAAANARLNPSPLSWMTSATPSGSRRSNLSSQLSTS